MENQLVKIVNESGLDKSKSQVLLENFSNYFEIAAEWEQKAKQLTVTREDQTAEMKMAREGRLFLKQKRVDVEKKRKELKENALREGQTIDSIARILKNLIEPIENHLENQEKFIEIRENERRQARKQDREKTLNDLQYDYTYMDLLNMEDEQFNLMVSGIKKEIADRKEAERKTEEERIVKEKAEREEQERIRKENERLKKEVEERERKAEAERKRIAAEREKERKDAEEKARIEAEKQAKIRAELEAKAEAERKKREELERIERERKDQIEKEQKAKADAERKAKNAPDKIKLIEFATRLKTIQRPELKGDEAAKIMGSVDELIEKICTFISEKTKSL